jgi:hypothetical protein
MERMLAQAHDEAVLVGRGAVREEASSPSKGWNMKKLAVDPTPSTKPR